MLSMQDHIWYTDSKTVILKFQWRVAGTSSPIIAACKHHSVLATLYLTFLLSALPPIKINSCLHAVVHLLGNEIHYLLKEVKCLLC